MKRRRHDGGHPGRLAVGGVELILQVRVEDSHTGGEAQGQSQDQDGRNQHHPAPAAIRSRDGSSRYGSGVSAFTTPPPLAVSVPLRPVLVQAVGKVESLRGLRVETGITRAPDSISLSHFLLGPSGRTLVLALRGVKERWLPMSLQPPCPLRRPKIRKAEQSVFLLNKKQCSQL